MQKNNRAGFSAYAATPLMMIVLYIIASLFFIFVLNDTATVAFFVVLGGIFVTMMVLYAIVPHRVKNVFRIVSIFLVSLILFGMASVLARQNLQVEGLFFYVFAGVFGGVIVHFAMAKIIGPLFTGRTWCGWGCWTLMLLELLPYKKSPGWKGGMLKYVKYAVLALSAVVVAVLVFGFGYVIHDPAQLPDQPGTYRALYWFLAGNVLYYAAGIAAAVALRDNRAFCKYLCPVSVFLKFSNTFSLLRIKGNAKACTECGACIRECPFSIDIPSYVQNGTRVTSTECVMCMACVAACPNGALSSSVGLDMVSEDRVKKVL
ncbi:MAG: 4Fe-4S binding protein [Spirochaetota bacterium]